MDSLDLTDIFKLSTIVKLLLIPSYFSTDFEVHRNWLAITSSLPLNKWYYENTSEWTLDYPPFFAYFEFLLSSVAIIGYKIAHIWTAITSQVFPVLPFYNSKRTMDPNFIVQFLTKFKELDLVQLWNSANAPPFLVINSHGVSTCDVIIFQRLTVIFADFVLFYAIYKYCQIFPQKKLALGVLLALNCGLLFVDNIHFQYNGFLYGLLILSVYHFSKGNNLIGSVIFFALMNFKHIFLYFVPAIGLFLLRRYIEVPGLIHIYKFNRHRLLLLVFWAFVVFAASFGPFYDHLGQVFSRLFPFKRGLCHALWAPNFWAIYSLVDRVLNFVTGGSVPSLTRGIVGDITFSFLPDVKPISSLFLTIIAQVPMLVKLWHSPNPKTLIQSVIISGFASFMFGWHVHEKAILMIVIPAILLIPFMADTNYLATVAVFTTVSYVSLFTLLFRAQETPIKIGFVILHFLFCQYQLKIKLGLFNQIIIFTIFMSQVVIIMSYFIFPQMEFMPIMITSVSCGAYLLYLFVYWTIQFTRREKDD